MFKKKITMKFSEYYSIKKNEYEIVKLIPSKSSKNNNSDHVALLINKMFIDVKKFIKIENKKLILEEQPKVSYYIHLTKDAVEFFFIIPKVHYDKFRIKFREIWKRVEIVEVDNIPMNKEASKVQLKYKNNDALSVNVNKRKNALIEANLNIIELLQDNDSVGIFYNFIPTSSKETRYFKSYKYPKAIQEYKKGYAAIREKNLYQLGLEVVKILDDIINDLLFSLLSADKESTNTFTQIKREVSSSTKRKYENHICKFQGIILAHSDDEKREKEILEGTINSYKVINDDNEIITGDFTGDIDIKSPRIKEASINYTTTEECANFMQLPGKKLIEEHTNIKHNAIYETDVPKCLTRGKISIGIVKKKQKSYFSNHKEISKAERVLIGPKGSGKTYKTKNLAIDAIKDNRGVVNIDIIEDCKLSKDIEKNTPKDRLIRIDCSDYNSIQALSYNEIPINSNMSDFEKVSNAIKRAQQLHNLLDCVNVKTELTPRMIKYFYAACSVVYCSNPYASLRDITNCLEESDIRKKFIGNIKGNLKDLLANRIKKLEELDGSKSSSKIDGIIDRIATLELSLESEVALNKTSEENINFVEAIQQNKVILIELPEDVFTNNTIKNVMATFFLSKVWNAKKQLSKKQKQITELYFDEFYKCPNASIIFEEIFQEGRKYNLISTVTLHTVFELSNKCRKALKTGGASYMLLYGTDIQDFRYLKEYYNNCGYEEEDLINLEEHNALCLIRNEEKNYSAFVAYLPA
ncbi:MAG: hypothetical protein SOX50_12615 [Terrisporobacter othiniensis]|uniref:hypothetical protein n=1 Tax=Terrisporobacter othiniensis TaxID=1577792 RepID=UPI002A75E151|nr:hypothetical protein [Terrisporobacter othiniensis]MDY3374105.1 hypothetical protein [Terrisporobacter othiniensis]